MDTNVMSTRMVRTVNRERSLRHLTSYERAHGTRIRRPARSNARQAAIRASLVGL